MFWWMCSLGASQFRANFINRQGPLTHTADTHPGPFHHQQHSCQGRLLPQLCPVQLQSMSTVLGHLKGRVVSFPADCAELVSRSFSKITRITATVPSWTFTDPCFYYPTHLLYLPTVETSNEPKCLHCMKVYWTSLDVYPFVSHHVIWTLFVIFFTI